MGSERSEKNGTRGSLGEPSLPEKARISIPYLPAQERSGRDVFPKRPTHSDYTSRSQQFDGRLGEPSLPEKARISISLPFLRKNVQVGTFFRNVRLSLITRRNPSNSTDGLESALRRPRRAIQPSIQMRGRRSAPPYQGCVQRSRDR